MQFDLAQTDALLSTTRAVRKRLDLDRPVPREVIMECLQLAVQAPTGSNSQTWRWMVVEDAAKKQAIAEMYGNAARAYLSGAAEKAEPGQTKRVYDSALWLADNMARVPVFVIPCVEGRLPDGSPNVMAASTYGSIFPAVWSFQLALRSRGLGSTLTTLHLMFEQQIAEMLGIPDNVMQVALLPVGYTKGTDFKPAERPPVSEITHWDSW
jgi:nitroreductase